MPTRFSVVVDDDRAREIESLARQYDLTEEAVLRQLIDLGLETLEIELTGEEDAYADGDEQRP